MKWILRIPIVTVDCNFLRRHIEVPLHVIVGKVEEFNRVYGNVVPIAVFALTFPVLSAPVLTRHVEPYRAPIVFAKPTFELTVCGVIFEICNESL
jgi:hypothetical protein